MLELTPREVRDFQDLVWNFYRQHRREMPWRELPSPYRVFVSELMLQQTQVQRVVPKFDAFMCTFPDFASLATASLSEVLLLWSGLGYNRRAKYLHLSARVIMSEHDGQLPSTVEALEKLPGVGKNTAGAVLAYAYNQPVAFIETNIRTVFFHHFFQNSKDAVNDASLRSLVELTLDCTNPREWYWALMDYGSHLKSSGKGRITLSKHYTKQSTFVGSRRAIRGAIIRTLTLGSYSVAELQAHVPADDRFAAVLHELEQEGMVHVHDQQVSLAE